MKKLLTFIFVLIAAGGGAYYYFVYDQEVEQPQVIMQPVSQGDIVEAVVATGSLGPVKTVNVGSQVSGTVQNLYFDFNDIVRPGQVMAQIDPTLLQTQVRIQEANIERQRGDIENQKIQLQDLQLQLQRTEEMHAKGLMNDRELEQARLAVVNRQAQIASSEKSLVSSEANLEQARLNVEYTTIKAPTEGIEPGETFVVVSREAEIGQTVQASMTTPQFFTLATDIRKLKLTAGVDEADIGKVRSGMEVRFTVDTYGTQEFVGTVNSVRLNASTQSNVVTYPVWIDVPNPDLKLRPSLTANVQIIVRTATSVVRVPNQATRFRPNAEIYTALGLVPPTTGQGTAGRGGAQTTAAPAPGGAATTPAAGNTGRGDDPATGRGETAAAEGRGFGQTGRNLDPSAMREVEQQFGGRASGRSGRGGTSSGTAGTRGTRTGGRGGGGANARPAGNQGVLTELQGTKIDENFAELQRTTTSATVWTWDETARELKSYDVRLGITDGTFTELVSGDLTPGMQLVTGVILPLTASTTSQQNMNSIFNQQQRGGGPGGFGGRGGGRGR